MAAPTDYFVDPDSGTDSAGKGAIGDPYLSVQYALNDIGTTHGQGANGDRVNVKNGTDDTVSSALTLATYGTPGSTQPLIIQGYSTAADDGGQGGISGGGSSAIWNDTTKDWIAFKDMHLHNCGSAAIVTGDDGVKLYNCELDNTTGHGIDIDQYGVVVNCYLYNIGGRGINVLSDGIIEGNYLANGTNDFTAAIYLESSGNSVVRNIISVDGSSDGIYLDNRTHYVAHNSILSSSGTGQGIDVTNTGADISIKANVVEGFSGGGGIGIDANYSRPMALYANNAVYDNDTEYNGPTVWQLHETDNETLSSSPFAKSGANTFANRFEYFRPLNTGNMRMSTHLYKGAVQGPPGVLGGIAFGGGFAS